MSSELVAIELRLKGYEGVMSDMRMLDTMLNNLRGRKNRIEIQNNLAKAKKDIIAYSAEVKRLQNELAKTDKYIKGTNLKTEKWTALNKQLQEAKAKLQDARQAATEFQYALKNLAPPTFMQVFSKISSAVGHAGSAMQSFGNALTRLTSPFRRFTTGLILNAGYRALNMITEGFGGAFERYDTMQTYAKSLKELGLDADQTFKVFSKQEKAMTAIDNLNESVLGLPTGLDEIVAAQKVYAGATNEMVKSTKLAIAANNTFISSTMGAREQRFMQRYLASLASGADLTTTQWQSIGRIAPLALNAVAEELEVTTDDLRNGRVEGEKFLEAFIKVGTEGKIQAAANVMKTTWEGLTANIQNATKRMGEGVLKALDEAFMSYNGRNFVQNLLGFDAEGNEVGGGIKHFINDISEGLQGWVKAHPQEIMDFFNALKSVDWRSLFKGIGDGFLELARLTQKAAEFLEGKDLSGIGKFMVMGNIWGKALTVTGGFIKGTRHIWGLLGAGAVIGLMKSRGFLKNGGLMGMLGRFIGGTGAAAAETATVAGTAAKTAPKMGKALTGLSAIFKGWLQIATMVGGTAFVGWASVKLFKNTIKDIKEIGELVNEVDWDSAGAALKAFGAFIGVFLTLGSAFGQAGAVAMKPAAIGTAVLGGLTVLVAGIADIDMALMKRTFKHFAKATEYLNEAIDNLNNVKSVKNVKDKVSNAIDTFNDVIAILKPKRTDKQTVEGGMQKLGGEIVKSLENLKESLSTINESVSLINTLNSVKLEDSNIEGLTQRIGTSIGFIAGMFNRMPESMQNGDAVETATNLKTSMANFNKSLGSIIGENGILSRIPMVLQSMTDLVRDGKLDVFESDMARLGDVLTNVFNSLQGIGNGQYFATNIDGFREGLKSMKYAIKHLQAISGMEVSNDVVAKIQGIIQSIEAAFDVGAIDRVSTNINTLVTSIKDALASFEELNEDIVINPKVKVGSGFDSSVNSSVKKIKGAKGKIESAINSIPSNYYKSVTVHIAVNAVTSGLRGAAGKAAQGAQQIYNEVTKNLGTGGRVSHNGVLYRGGGGSIFKPRGTDKIPAMLTQGEYVQRKQAVDFFGIDFMRKVNNMDVRGAMQALLTRGGTNIGVGRQSVMNSTVNNNQRVNMTVNTNNPNFASMRMGRFVGAL